MKQGKPSGFRVRIRNRKSQIRSVVWIALVLGTAVNLLPNLGNGFRLSTLGPLLGIVLTGTLVEILMFIAEPRDRLSLAESQLDLLNVIPPLFELIKRAPEVSIIGGTMKTFTDDVRNLNAIKSMIDDGKNVRILLMHPSGGGVESTARARMTAGKGTTTEMLAQEIEHSLNRLTNLCGEPIEKSIRLYREHPTFSLYDFGSSCLLTVYTLGRGASSPAIFIPSATANMDFVSGLRAGFKELWTAPTTESLELVRQRKKDETIEPILKNNARRNSSREPRKS